MLYLLVMSDRFVKVGFTDNFESRMANYRTHNPEFKVVATREGDKQLEKLYQSELSAYGERVDNSEWYALTTPNLMQSVKDLGFGFFKTVKSKANDSYAQVADDFNFDSVLAQYKARHDKEVESERRAKIPSRVAATGVYEFLARNLAATGRAGFELFKCRDNEGFYADNVSDEELVEEVAKQCRAKGFKIVDVYKYSRSYHKTYALSIQL